MDLPEKIDIDDRYKPEEELARLKLKPSIVMNQSLPMFQALHDVFDMFKVESFIDIGCRDGQLMYLVARFSQNIRVMGVDYFQWMKDDANELIRSAINVYDLRDPIKSVKDDYELVVSTEVGEHIDPGYAEIYLTNIAMLMKPEGHLVMSWAEKGGDKNGQHLNPLKRNQFIDLMDANDFELDVEKTEELLEASKIRNVPQYYIDSNLTIWKKK